MGGILREGKHALTLYNSKVSLWYGVFALDMEEIMLHDDDEYLKDIVFLEGIGAYVGLVEMLGLKGKEVDDVVTAATGGREGGGGGGGHSA
eukprot:1806346-Ditylum_brightwellii.AAC.1